MFINQKVSLEDILGKDYIGALCAANSALGMMDAEEAAKIASEKIDFLFRRGSEEKRRAPFLRGKTR